MSNKKCWPCLSFWAIRFQKKPIRQSCLSFVSCQTKRAVMPLFWSKLFPKSRVMPLFQHNTLAIYATMTLFPRMPLFRHQRVLTKTTLRINGEMFWYNNFGPIIWVCGELFYGIWGRFYSGPPLLTTDYCSSSFSCFWWPVWSLALITFVSFDNFS